MNWIDFIKLIAIVKGNELYKFFFGSEEKQITESKSGHKIVPIEGEEEERICKDWPLMKFGGIRLEPGGWVFYKSFAKFADKMYDFQFKPTDVVIMTYPKCGTTWTQEIVWTIRSNINFDHPDQKESIMLRSPFLDADFFFEVPLDVPMPIFNNPFIDFFVRKCPGKNPYDGVMLQIAESLPEPRTIKTHLPLSLFPPDLLDKCKVIYVARNPMDACVSYYHHNKLMLAHNFVGSWDSFVDHFIDDTPIYNPYWTHIKEAWDKRDHPNLLFCFYEEMKKDPKKNIERINDFLGSGLNKKQIEKVLDHTSFSSMKQKDTFMGSPGEVPFIMNKKVFKEDGGFFRKGQSGDWKTKFTEEQKKKMQKSIRENLSKGFDKDFPYWEFASSV